METYNFIDGNYLMHRSIHKGEGLTYEGIFTGGAYIFLKVLLSLSSLKNTVVVFDGGHSKRRKDILPSYKVKDKYDDEFKERFKITQKILKEILPTLGVAVVQLPNQEADDIIYWLSTKFYSSSIVHTDDEDYLQLLQWNVKIHRPMKGEFYSSEKDFIVKYGYHPKYLALKKSLMGDSSDNIPGIQGIGDKRATLVVKELDKKGLPPTVLSLEEVLKGRRESWARKILGNLEIVERNLKLIDFRYVEFNELVIELDFSRLNIVEASKKLSKYGFKSLIPSVVKLV